MSQQTPKTMQQTSLTNKNSKLAKIVRVKNWSNLVVAALFLPSLYYLCSANPSFAGWIILGTGGIFLLLALKKHRANFRYLTIPGFIFLLGILLVLFASKIKPILLDRIYLYNGNTINLTLNPREKLNKKTLSFMQGRGLEDLWPLRLSQSSQIVQLDKQGEALSQLSMPNSEHGKVIFLLGAAGTGKTPLLHQWSNVIIKRNIYNNVFFLDLRSKREILKNKPLLSELVANQYRDIVASSDYYNMLFESHPCLIMLDEFDEVDIETEQYLLIAAASLSQQTQTTVVIASRPESVLLSDYFQGYSTHSPYTIVYTIEPLNDSEWDFFLQKAVEDQKTKGITVDMVKGFLETHKSLKNVTENLNFLNGIINNFNALQGKSDFEVIEFLVQGRIRSNKEDQWLILNINADERIKDIYGIAYQMSSQNKTRIGIEQAEKLYLSGFATVGLGAYEFSPKILQSYFAVKALQVDPTIKSKPVLSKMLLEDIGRFDSPPDSVARFAKK